MENQIHCPGCGQLLQFEQDGSAVCSRCNTRFAASPSGRLAPAVQQGKLAERSEEMARTFIRSSPWIISILLHATVGICLTFVVLMVRNVQVSREITVPDVYIGESAGPAMGAGDGSGGDNKPFQQTVQPSQDSSTYTRRSASNTRGTLGRLGSHKTDVIGVGAGGGQSNGLASMGLTSGRGAGAGTSFFGAGGNAYHIVYVIDRSGSMIDTFDSVRKEMLRSISRLSPPQDFHVILFAGDAPMENSPKRLVPSESTYKLQVAEWLAGTQPLGQTNPVPALERAFEVLSQSSDSKGKLIYLLTDAEFPNNEAVLAAISRLNEARQVRINTYLYGSKPPEAEKVMQSIANENSGRYKYVSMDE